MIHRLLIQGPNFLDFLAIPFSTSKILNLNIHPTKKLMGAFSIQPLHYLSAKVRSKMIPFLWRSVFPVFNPNFNFCRNICEFIYFLSVFSQLQITRPKTDTTLIFGVSGKHLTYWDWDNMTRLFIISKRLRNRFLHVIFWRISKISGNSKSHLPRRKSN